MIWIYLSLAAAFVLELVLCLKLNRVMVKLSPVFVVLAGMLVCAVLFSDGALAGTYGGYSGGTLLMAFFFWGAMLVAAMLLAWPVYWIVDHIRCKRMMEED